MLVGYELTYEENPNYQDESYPFYIRFLLNAYLILCLGLNEVL